MNDLQLMILTVVIFVIIPVMGKASTHNIRFTPVCQLEQLTSKKPGLLEAPYGIKFRYITIKKGTLVNGVKVTEEKWILQEVIPEEELKYYTAESLIPECFMIKPTNFYKKITPA